MIKIITISTALTPLIIGVAHAQGLISCPDGTQADPSIGCVTIPTGIVNSNTSIPEILLKIASIGTTGVIAIASALCIVGGILYATAMGDEEKTQKAKRLLFWGALGLALSVTARLVVGAVTTAL